MMEAKATLKNSLTVVNDFLTSEDLSKPHVCGVLARHYGTCPACMALTKGNDNED
jgi:hypothetical protein